LKTGSSAFLSPLAAAATLAVAWLLKLAGDDLAAGGPAATWWPLVAVPAPLVVALHGCQQSAADYARQAGWAQQADRWGFVLLLPEQQKANNGQRCFNWFRPESTGRDQGEAGSIRRMIAQMQADNPIDPRRIFVAGLSAGGAMTAVLLADYPELFAGGAIVAGVPYGCASGLTSALRCQLWGRDLEPSEWGDLVRQATAEIEPKPKTWPLVSIWQGDSDWVVDPANARELLEQWTALHGLDPGAGVEEVGKGYSHRIYRDAAGRRSKFTRSAAWAMVSLLIRGQAKLNVVFLLTISSLSGFARATASFGFGAWYPEPCVLSVALWPLNPFPCGIEPDECRCGTQAGIIP